MDGCKNSGVSGESPILTTRCRVCCRSPWRSAATNLSKLSGFFLGRFKRDFMDRLLDFRFRVDVRYSQPPMRGCAESSMVLHVREQAFKVGRSSDRYPRILSTSSGGRRTHPLARSTVEGTCRGLGWDVARADFFQNRNVNCADITGAQRKPGSGHNWETHQNRARLSSPGWMLAVGQKEGRPCSPPLQT